MNADIEFGDLEQTQPLKKLRPDRNKHYAVASCYAPVDTDLPIFIDLDVMRDMELHAMSDTSVELGGVMLGGQYEDEDGNPFVVVNESLRAEHYEATKGSFKFTHETWESISRRRDEFPQEFEMVGWYHTHPDWGVFLSGMDMFICDNFFNKTLDLALVIDPCRDDRGWFQWTGDETNRIRRTAGFFVIASRFRRNELEYFASQITGESDMPAHSRYSAIAGQVGGSAPPVVNIAESQNPALQFGILGLFAVQFAFMALVAWQLYSTSTATISDESNSRLKAIEEKVDRAVAVQDAAIRQEAQSELLGLIVAQVSGERPDFAQRFVEQSEENQLLHGSVLALTSQQTQLQRDLTNQFKTIEVLTSNDEEKESRLKQKTEEISVQKAEIDDLNTKIAALNKELGGPTAWWQDWTTLGIVGGVGLLLSTLGFGAGYVVRGASDDEEEETVTPEFSISDDADKSNQDA